MHTFWITFYSYKGGVGRSMALANVAASLASRGRRVLMVDFDLEAPGLDSFEEFDVPRGRIGLVEYVCAYLDNGSPAPITDHIHEIHPMDFGDSDAPKPRNIDGKLWLMTSGAKNDAYNQKRLSIDWADLYDNHSGAEFFENFKAEIEDTYRPDYVLIDSRTGLTDVGGVCTLHLPDLVVLLGALNEQNLQGIASVARVLRDSEKFPQIIPVATPVPNLQGGKESLLDQRMQRAKELLGTEIKHTLSYSPVVALKERILVWEPSMSPLHIQYKELADALREADPAGIDFLQRQARDSLENLESDRAAEIGAILSADYADRADSWLILADIAKSEGDLGRFESALYRALDLSPGNRAAYRRIEALLRGKKRHQDLVNLITDTLEKDGHLGVTQRTMLLIDRGALHMKLGRPYDALTDYEEILARTVDEDEEDTLPTLFNMAEARRRSTRQIAIEDWKRIVRIFETTSAGVSSLPTAQRANHTQAMHIAYACLGDLAKAKALLEDTAKVLTQVSPQERVFSVAEYDDLPLGRFLERNQQMLEALDRGELWDGMKLG